MKCLSYESERAKVGVNLRLDERLNASAQERQIWISRNSSRSCITREGIHGYELVFKHASGECRHAGENLAWRTNNTVGTTDAF